MTALRDGLQRLASETEKRLQEAFRRYEAGTLSRETFVAVAATILLRARARGVALADIALTADAARALGNISAPLGLGLPEGDAERLRQSVATVLDQRVETASTPEQERESRLARLGRLARDSAAEATVWATREGMQRRDTRGWVRVTDPNPCPVCVRLADGIVRSPVVVMKRHTGCMCVQGSVF